MKKAKTEKKEPAKKKKRGEAEEEEGEEDAVTKKKAEPEEDRIKKLLRKYERWKPKEEESYDDPFLTEDASSSGYGEEEHSNDPYA